MHRKSDFGWPGPQETFQTSGGASANRVGPDGQTVGLFKNSPQAFPGYTLFAPKHHTLIYLIDNQGRAVHQWKSQYEPGQSVYLLENGHLLHCCFTRNKGFTRGGEGGRLEEFDWDGNLVWEFEYSSDKYLSHHDVKPLPNGNILMLAVEKKSYEECLAAGFDPRMLRDEQLFPEHMIEVQPTRPKGGKIVLSARGCNEIWVIDHSTTTKEAAGHTGGKGGKPFGPQRPVWKYQARNPTDFYSSEISGAHRLPNGNTLICAGVRGVFFEVTPAGETVWEYVNPVVHDGVLAQGKRSGQKDEPTNTVFRAYRYSPDYAGLVGKDLTPGEKLEDVATQQGEPRRPQRPQ